MTQESALTARAKMYLGIVIVAGILVVALSAFELYAADVPADWLILAGLTVLSGSFMIRVPRVPARLSVSDAFVFASVMLFGPATATVMTLSPFFTTAEK